MKYLCLLLFTTLITSFVTAQSRIIQFANADAPLINIDSNNIALNGYDVTEYFSNNQAQKGLSNLLYNHEGVIYFFKNEKNRKSFIENPEKYLPQFGGYCAYGIGMETDSENNPPGKYPVNPQTFKVINQKLYLFYNNHGFNFLKKWENDEKVLLKRANKRWKELMKLH